MQREGAQAGRERNRFAIVGNPQRLLKLDGQFGQRIAVQAHGRPRGLARGGFDFGGGQ